MEAYASMYEEREIGFGYDDTHVKKGIKAAHASGLKINHIGNSEHDSGNKPGDKPHAKPDITIHYERGDTPHRDGASGATLHTNAAKNHAAAKHFDKAEADEDY